MSVKALAWINRSCGAFSAVQRQMRKEPPVTQGGLVFAWGLLNRPYHRAFALERRWPVNRLPSAPGLHFFAFSAALLNRSPKAFPRTQPMKFRLPLLLSVLIGLTVNGQVHGGTAVKTPQKAEAGSKAQKGKQVKKAGQRNRVIEQQLRSPPAATLASGHETVLEAGCADPETMAQIGARLQMQTSLGGEDQPMNLAAVQWLPCRHYAAAVTRPLVRNTMAVLTPARSQPGIDAVIYSRAASEDAPLQTRWHLDFEAQKLRQISTASLRADGVDLQEIVLQLQWEVDLIAKLMISSLKIEPSAHHLRITLSPDTDGSGEKIYAIELIESATSRRVEAAIWLERKGVPGAYFSLQGIEYERLLWQSPVQNARISRGVGPSVTTVRRRVAVVSRKSKKPQMAIRTFRVRGQHIGIDFAAPTGTPVVAVADGEVIHSGFNGGYGNLIIVDHGDGHHTYYAHLSAYSADIRPGVQVRRGEEIGLVGSTGFSTGPHLHFEIRKQGQYIDPASRSSRLRFWTLAEQEQSDLVARLIHLQLGPAQMPAVIEANRNAIDN